MSASVHARTPILQVRDSRGLAVRRVDYCRGVAQEVAEARIQRWQFNAAGHLCSSRDARLHATGGPANLVSLHALSGREVSRDSVDAGFYCTLFGEAGQVVWAQDGKGNRRELEHDLLLRPLALFEQEPGQTRQCSERQTYAPADPALAPGNLCGRLVRHDDTAGSRQLNDYALGGQVAGESRRFLVDDAWPDWPLPLDERDALLEPQAALSRWRHGPLGDVFEQTDAAGNRQRVGFTLAGQVRDIQLSQAGEPTPRMLVTKTRHDAFGHVVERVLGNGVTLSRQHRAQDGRLMRLGSRRGNGDWLQDLHYDFDPAGLVLSITDQAIPLRHFANQRIEARSEYRYDSLGQLLEATGREAGARGQGPDGALDPAAMANYRQTYRYDAGGNLLQLIHVGAQAHGRELMAAAGSNRCLALVEGRPPTEEDFAAAFDANGNPRQLQPGQVLHWDRRNRLAGTDQERYHYDGVGQRLRKWRSQVVAGRSVVDEVRYLPGVERHRRGASGECFDVLVVDTDGVGIRVLHWQAGRPSDVPQNQYRYALGDHLGSTSVELDGEAGLISREGYYPFGETAWHAARNEVEAGYRTLRYSGKERDASGLYYYGARYYRADWQRWLNPDPAGAVDGLNLYAMVGNSPVNRRDVQGTRGFDVLDDAQHQWLAQGADVRASALADFPADLQGAVRQGLLTGKVFLNNAIAALDGGSGESVSQALQSTFGITDFQSDAARQSLLAELRGVLGESRDYQSKLEQDESWRLSLIHSAHVGGAGVTGLSRNRGVRIGFDEGLLRGNVIDRAMTFTHESFHAVSLGLLSTSPMDIVSDFFYSTPPLTRTGSIPAMMDATHHLSRRIISSGPDEAAMSGADQQRYVQLIERESERLGLKPPGDAEERRQYFVTHPQIRQTVVMRNAASLTGFVLMLQRRPAAQKRGVV
ncbi:RHS repeat-associated core domain-containing protein [Pseudomonas sp. 148P]|uniref:RHS repeat-associated core domain-containing protein n=1 Tax=Pseudomonas ulcerans TaxID=3115852 RepID=A0ABU7HU67_9PSED|nr:MULTISPECIES: RHS repeat-associated core domain-containing protein [unclassified Pseudomonas]MEE1923902.1 RHS repeat-associated core domain-containing protein [Pseudomonas sp. 147P]MEE1935079.1 RHS repeat-associated core domain-containing protein [Pseudomonas sp. 148P]